MTAGPSRVCGMIVMCLFIIAGLSAPATAKLPEGFRDVKLGMTKDQVLELLKKNPSHFSYDDRGSEIGEIVRGDNLFRYATYRFNKDRELVEISLQMREVIGRDHVLQTFNSKHGLHISPHQKTVEANHSIEVNGNGVFLRLEQATDARAARENSSAHTAR
jgi:hypothetical protein